MGGGARAVQGLRVAYHPLPFDLVAALPSLPFPVYLQHRGRMVLYAAPGTDLRPARGRARPDLEVRVATDDTSSLPLLLLSALGRELESGAHSGRARGGRAAGLAIALLAPLFGPEPVPDRRAMSAGLAAVDLLSEALAADPALGRALVAADAPAAGPGEPAGGTASGRRLARRALVGLVCQAAATRVIDPGGSGLDGLSARDLGRGVAFRDVGLARARHATPDEREPMADRHSAADRAHPEIGVRTLAAALGEAPRWSPLVAGHHQRLDGSGYPARPAGRALLPSVQVAGLSDALTALITSGGPGRPPAAEEAARLLARAARGRFDGDLTAALLRSLRDGLVLPAGRPPVRPPAH